MTMKSRGLKNVLPHYRNSRASVSKYEPVYKNLFSVEITLPTGLGADGQQTNLLLEAVQKVGGLKSHKMPAAVEQKYKYATRSFAGPKPEQTFMDLALSFTVNLDEENSPYVVKTLRRWCDLVYDPLTGSTGLKKDYTAPSMIVTIHDRQYQPFWQWKCYDIFPTSAIPAVDPEYNSSDLFQITDFTLRCDWWDESML